MLLTILNIITPEQYVNLYYVLLSFLLLFFLLVDNNLESAKGRLLFIAILSFLFMGLRPFSQIFTDMGSYVGFYNASSNMETIVGMSDSGFVAYMKIMSHFFSAKVWLFITALIYVLGYCILYLTLSGRKSGFIFLILYLSFSFFPYGTNTIRAGLANSLFMVSLALFLKNRFVIAACFSLLAFSFHSSMSMLILSAVCSILYKNMKSYYYFWIICLVLSLLLGNSVSDYLSSVVTFDDRFTSYVKNSDNSFRWDFFIFGVIPLVWSFVLWNKIKYRNAIYFWLVRIFIMVNGFWLLIIRANFSDRFAYMSWSLIPIILTYPLLDNEVVIDNRVLYYKFFLFINGGLTLYLYLA